jgi:hypothetical protein
VQLQLEIIIKSKFLITFQTFLFDTETFHKQWKHKREKLKQGKIQMTRYMEKSFHFAKLSGYTQKHFIQFTILLLLLEEFFVRRLH